MFFSCLPPSSDMGEVEVTSRVVEDTANSLGPVWDYIYFAVSCFWLTVGIPGNALVIVAVLYFKELKLFHQMTPFNHRLLLTGYLFSGRFQ